MFLEKMERKEEEGTRKRDTPLPKNKTKLNVRETLPKTNKQNKTK